MNFWKTVIIFTKASVVFAIGLAVIIGGVTIMNGDIEGIAELVVGLVAIIVLSSILSSIVSLVVVGWAYAAYTLIDDENVWYQLFALLITGVVGIIWLLGIRWIYRKLGLTVFS